MRPIDGVALQYELRGDVAAVTEALCHCALMPVEILPLAGHRGDEDPLQSCRSLTSAWITSLWRLDAPNPDALAIQVESIAIDHMEALSREGAIAHKRASAYER